MSNTNRMLGLTWIERKWWCADCRVPINLDRHGRCDSCGSDAVDMMLHPNRVGHQLRPTRIVLEDMPHLVRIP
ncbi:MAG TPA: hypothetical protein VGS15_03875 [Candidatus Acidoferrales bacterium]|nr:hypothetical protein [Candidatus Acidoferrales bacterium]